MDGYITIGTKLDTKSFDAQILSVERKIEEIEKELSDNKELGFLSDREVSDLNVELERSKNKLIQLRSEKEKLEKTGGLDKLGNSFQGLIKKAGKLALGVFGIRSAYMALRRASSDLASYDPQYAANLEYIRFVLTQAIAPILRWIVQMAGTLLGYVGSILKSLFGIDIFANSSVNAFKKMKTNANGVSKAVKEIRKQLAGFDEANVLTKQDTSTGGGTGYVAPTIDFSMQLPSIKDVFQKVKDIWTNVFDWLKQKWDEFGEKFGFEGIVESAKGMIDGISKIIYGVIDVVSGVLQMIVNIFTGNEEEIKEGFWTFITGLEEILEGLLQYSIESIKNMWYTIWYTVLEPIVDFVYKYLIKPIIDNAKKSWEWLVSTTKTIKDKMVSIFKDLKEKSTIIFEDLKTIINSVLSMVEMRLNGLINTANNLIGILNIIPRYKNR